jgi:hypothetical protein
VLKNKKPVTYRSPPVAFWMMRILPGKFKWV